jgi:hypothetical protein
LLAVALQPPGKIEFQQDNVHFAGSRARWCGSARRYRRGWGRGRR